jgi:hypothetical protein
MPSRSTHIRVLQVFCFVLSSLMLAEPQAKPTPSNYSGMYSFLHDGEFVQITAAENGNVIGFVSRYGRGEDDRDRFLEHFFKTGKLDANHLTFSTETVKGVWFEFRGMIERGEGKNQNDEGYYLLRGTLVENTTDADTKNASQSRNVLFKRFPQDVAPTPSQPK